MNRMMRIGRATQLMKIKYAHFVFHVVNIDTKLP